MQPTQLYLDTARLGQMSGKAQRMLSDFTSLAGQEGGSLFFEQFLKVGTSDWPDAARNRFPDLIHWRGVGALKQNLRSLASSDPELPVLMVNRSTQLMMFAARLLFRRCECVAVTDLCWPRYRDILERESKRVGRPLASIHVKSLMAEPGITEGDVIESVRKQCLQTNADGLFLTAVSHLGVRLPLQQLVRSLEAERNFWSIVVDGAQEFCQSSADLNHEYCDLYLTGCHKWLQGFHPMGLGYYGRKRSRGTIQTLLDRLLACGDLDDPLLRFTNQLETGKLDSDTETVNLVPLFTCQGAVLDALDQPSNLAESFDARQLNATQAATAADQCGWKPVLPAESFRSGILLLQSKQSQVRSKDPAQIRKAFAEQGIALSAYEGGHIRLSMPSVAWQASDVDFLAQALSAVA